MRAVALYVVVLVSHSYRNGELSLVELAVTVTAACALLSLRAVVPGSMVQMAQRTTSLTLILVTVGLWVRQQTWGTAAGALALSLTAQWWVEENARRRAGVEGAAWRLQLLRELRAVRQNADTLDIRSGSAMPGPLAEWPRPERPHGPNRSRAVGGHHARSGHHRATRRVPSQNPSLVRAAP